jgi:hypothetical protein
MGVFERSVTYAVDGLDAQRDHNLYDIVVCLLCAVVRDLPNLRYHVYSNEKVAL